MKLHIYDTSEQGERCRAVVQAVGRSIAKADFVQYRSLSGLLKGLGWNAWDEPGIIFTKSDDELEQILGHVEQLSNCRIVLILHDDKLLTLAKGHKLRPRILFSQPVGAETIAAVIVRMLAGPARSGRQMDADPAVL